MGRIEVKIEDGGKYYFFTTKEKVMVCPRCNNNYLKRKFCLKCWKGDKIKIKTKPDTKEYEGKITKDLSRYMCTCVFSSFFGWGGHWKKNYPKSNCRHVKWALKKINSKSGKSTKKCILGVK